MADLEKYDHELDEGQALDMLENLLSQAGGSTDPGLPTKNFYAREILAIQKSERDAINSHWWLLTPMQELIL